MVLNAYDIKEAYYNAKHTATENGN